MITPLVKEVAASLIKDTAPSASASDTPTIIDDPWGSSSWRWGRWILFVIFVAFILVLIIATARANRNRYVRGQAPIRGTAWFTPPSYRQSEREYVGNSQQHVQDFVPQYTETANENDLGYYDERGEFHSNDKTTYVPPPALDTVPPSAAQSPTLQRPQPAVTRPQEVDADDAMDFSRPVFRTDTTNTFPGYFGTPASGSSRERSHSHSSSSNIKKMDTVEEIKELK
ncbi:Rcr2 protein [Maudiozyma humilis]|uniref:Rcr2 protein n=1 Tax=Maudiozyma humilis TaxID=51915 RepID=A0AAV5S387_MAUHU|nr:Rcr2 protein [Kazachstania humilis]